MRLPAPDLDYLRRVLLEMLAIPSPTGFTDTLVRYVAERLDELGIPYELTRRGTIRATLKGRLSSPDRAVSAHLDTICASVREIKDSGRLALAMIGLLSLRTMGMVAPIGGTLMIAGWIVLAIAAFRSHNVNA